MADVKLNIAGREYVVTCRDGEELHLQDLGNAVDEKAREAGGSAGGLNESRQLLFASLLLADEAHDLRSGKTNQPATNLSPAMGANALESDQIAATLEKLADRIEALAAGLEL